MDTTTLDTLTARYTAFRSFAGLLAGGEQGPDAAPVKTSYSPSIYPGQYAEQPEIDELRALADGYDAAQAERGDARRAYRGPAAWWLPSSSTPPTKEERPRRRGRLGARQLALLTSDQLRTREQHLLVRADAPGIPGAGHSHSRQLREVRQEMARRG